MTTSSTPLIPRDVLFGNPVRAAPDLAPDGRRIGYLAPSADGVLNVWVRTIGRDDDVQVTHDSYRGVREFFFAEDDRHLLYLQDRDGDENFHVLAVDLATGTERDLTPYDGVKAQNVQIERRRPGEILVGLNLRDRTLFDMHRIDLATGATALDTENPGDVVAFSADADLVVRAAIAMDPRDGSTELRVRDADGAPWRVLVHWPFGDDGNLETFLPGGTSAAITTTLGADTSRLVEVDLATGVETATIAVDPRCDVHLVRLEPGTRRVQAVGFAYQRLAWRVVDPSVEADFAALAAACPGDFDVIARDRADRTWIVACTRDDGPYAWYLYDRGSRSAELLFVNQPDLARHRLARVEPVTIRARDGLELPSYLALPPGAERPLPMVLLVHGGPWARDTWGYDAVTQWLANRGYAVLRVNFRGSTGFGKSFLNAGDGTWGVGAMQHDLTDAVAWAVASGIADPRRVAIMGGSYGGYATLAGLTFTPGVYACGVDIVGPAHIRTLFASIPPYWEPLRQVLVRRVGDAEHDDELNRRISPAFHAERIRAPLIVAQGQNDPRVRIAESDQMVEAIRGRGGEVAYVVYPDEGHGFARPENRLDFYGRVEEFLAAHLGGRFQPWAPVPSATAELR